MMAAPRQPKVGGLRLAGGQSSLESFVTRRIGGLPGDGVPVVRALQAAGNRVLDRREAGPGVENSTGVEFDEHAVARSSAATSVGGQGRIGSDPPGGYVRVGSAGSVYGGDLRGHELDRREADPGVENSTGISRHAPVSPSLSSDGPLGTGRLVLGSWNMSRWASDKVHMALAELDVHVLALQETHLAIVPLNVAHRCAKAAGLHLHHGHPVPAVSNATWGRSCGVGFLAAGGVAACKQPPVGPAWRRLHAIGRMHAIRLAPRVGLPLGLLLITVYVPLQGHGHEAERTRFVESFMEVSHGLDMQVPTLVMGDFNGALCPWRDFRGESGRLRLPCPLLAHLLGPGAPWVDVHRALVAEPAWTFQSVDTQGRLSASRIDLVLANHSAMNLVRAAWVASELRDGGHSPVMVELCMQGTPRLVWQQPRPRLPPLMMRSSADLRLAPEWAALVASWEASPEARGALDASHPHSSSSLSAALVRAVQHLVALAGGWTKRPARPRLAYASNAIQRLIRQQRCLHRLEGLTRCGPDTPGCWPRTWVCVLTELQALGVHLVGSSLVALRKSLGESLMSCRARLAQLRSDMRRERHQRWLATLPSLWQSNPGVVYGWLHETGASWGTVPILGADGLQCCTVEAVDEVVRAFWVKQVLCQHQFVDEGAAWASFLESAFGRSIPHLEWPEVAWSGPRVRQILASMREGAASGMLGLPIAVWKSLPEACMGAIGRLFSLIEEAGCWPAEWLGAYVAMIPKASGGSRPQDQRPITVLEVLYRVWSKGLIQAWSTTVHGALLGPTTMGFRAQAGTLHVAQLLSDLMALQAQRGQELWLASFDIVKCFDSLPWWAVFGVMEKVGLPLKVVCCFRAFYRNLQRRFRYGQVDGSMWQAANGVAQGCPASPMLLNLLFETFHRWALGSGHGVNVGGFCVASVGYADDSTLVGRSQVDLEALISSFLGWCSLLGLQVTKVSVWCSVVGAHEVRVGDGVVSTSPTFKTVGVVLGLSELRATEEHFTPRLLRALATAQRLRALDLPSSVSSLLWQTAVLPQALYGCEVRDLRPPKLVPLASAGKAIVGAKFPLRLNGWRAPEVLMGPPLGESAVRDPRVEMCVRRVSWLQLLANSPGIVGVVHRLVACPVGSWVEPCRALQSGLVALGWSVQRNMACLQARAWPELLSEPAYLGAVHMDACDVFPSELAVFTDGSVCAAGGSAAVCVDPQKAITARVACPRSSTHCELVALILALQLDPGEVFTDSLTSLRLIGGWALRSPRAVLSCADRVEVRQFVSLAAARNLAPAYGKSRLMTWPPCCLVILWP